MLDTLKIFGIFYFISVAFMYMLFYRGGQPVIIPGDIYIKKSPRTIYIPTGGAFVLALILFLLLKRFIPQ
jgi:hypothetical protein